MHRVIYTQIWAIHAKDHARGQENISTRIEGDIYDMLSAVSNLRAVGYKRVKGIYAGMREIARDPM